MSLVCPSCDVVPAAGATAGAACTGCGAPLRELQLVDLGEHTGAPPPTANPPAAAPAASAPPPLDLLRPDLVNEAAGDLKLELEGGWAKERAARLAGARPLSPLAARVIAEQRTTERRKRGTTFAMLLVLAVAGAGVFLYLQASKESATTASPAAPSGAAHEPAHKPAHPAPATPPATAPAPARAEVPEPASANTIPARGVSIRIVGARGTPITIDGAKAGKTPVTLQRRPSKQPIVVSANGKTWQVIPDRNLTVDITK